MLTGVLLGVVIGILIAILVAVLKRQRGIEKEEIEAAISKSWVSLGIDEKIGAIAETARKIEESHISLEKLLRIPTERGALGEIALEQILEDQLPPDMFGIRKKVLDGRIPDAHIKSTVGIICIDSKFPLENYWKLLETDNETKREELKKMFRRDLIGHLEKVRRDYVCPEKGSAEFAFCYIPSEGVYYYLLQEEYETLRKFTKKGVQVVSPLTLSHKIELIKAGVHAKKLSEEAKKVKKDLLNLSQKFMELDEKWRVFYNTHLRNAEAKASEVNEAYRRLRDEFDRIRRFSSE